LKELFEAMRTAWTGPMPQGVRVLADSIALSELLPPSPTWETVPGTPLRVPVGVEAETLQPFEFDLDNGPHFLISGAAGGGKTSLLETLLLALAERFPPSRLKMYLFALGSARLLPFSRLPHCAAFIEDNERLTAAANELTAELDARRKALEELRRSSDALVDETAFINRYPALLLASDDFDIFRTTCSEPNKKLLDNLISRRGLGLHLVFAGPPADFSSTMDPVARTLKNGQTGFVVGSNDMNDLGVLNLRPARAGQFAPGRAYFSRRGRFQILQTAAAFLGEPDLIAWIQAICRKREEEK
jgi:DNA segregation ATPase FtsK/SpoIIIE, S-DNA-T family